MLQNNNISISSGSQPVETKSDEIQEVLHFVPSWTIRWGITAIFFTVLMIICVAWYIRYPDIVTSRITLTSISPPVTLIARTNGQLTELNVHDGDSVYTGFVLAVIENSSNSSEVFTLKEQLTQFKPYLDNPADIRFEFNRFYQLGELQTPYSELLRKWEDYKSFYSFNYHPRKIQTIRAQIIVLNELNSRLEKQKNLLEEEVKLAEKNLNTGKSLREKGVASEIELSNYESIYLQKKYGYENAEAALINNTLQISEYEKNILDLTRQFEEEKSTKTVGMQEGYKSLLVSIDNWEQRYVLKAPIDGKVSFFKVWSVNQYVQTNDLVFTIVGDHATPIGKIYLQTAGLGKIKEGQKVQIKLDNYPYHEFGVLNGTVESIAPVATNNEYAINIALAPENRTTYHKAITFSEGMQGTAEIITDDLRLLERIFYQMRALTSSN